MAADAATNDILSGIVAVQAVLATFLVKQRVVEGEKLIDAIETMLAARYMANDARSLAANTVIRAIREIPAGD